MTNNMELWNKVCRTDPDSTTHVTVRGGFTAICAMSQIQAATEQFGAAGEGWGWSFSDPVYPPNETVVVKCILWHGKKENTIEQFGQKKLANDEDALKKAGTDALTKCLSYLGFNADVFLGKFDDNKYVAELREENQKKTILPAAAAQKSIADRLKAKVSKLMIAKELLAWEKLPSVYDARANLPSELSKEVDEAVKKKHLALAPIPSPSGLPQ